MRTNHHWAYFKNLPLKRAGQHGTSVTRRPRDALEGEKDAIALGVLLLVDVDRAVDHRDDTVAELVEAPRRENAAPDDKRAATHLLMHDSLRTRADDDWSDVRQGGRTGRVVLTLIA